MEVIMANYLIALEAILMIRTFNYFSCIHLFASLYDTIQTIIKNGWRQIVIGE